MIAIAKHSRDDELHTSFFDCHSVLVDCKTRILVWSKTAAYSSCAQVCVRLSVVNNANLYLCRTILGY
jgi:hypothetical protein